MITMKKKKKEKSRKKNWKIKSFLLFLFCNPIIFSISCFRCRLKKKMRLKLFYIFWMSKKIVSPRFAETSKKKFCMVKSWLLFLPKKKSIFCFIWWKIYIFREVSLDLSKTLVTHWNLQTTITMVKVPHLTTPVLFFFITTTLIFAIKITFLVLKRTLLFASSLFSILPISTSMV